MVGSWREGSVFFHQHRNQRTTQLTLPREGDLIKLQRRRLITCQSFHTFSAHIENNTLWLISHTACPSNHWKRFAAASSWWTHTITFHIVMSFIVVWSWPAHSLAFLKPDVQVKGLIMSCATWTAEQCKGVYIEIFLGSPFCLQSLPAAIQRRSYSNMTHDSNLSVLVTIHQDSSKHLHRLESRSEALVVSLRIYRTVGRPITSFEMDTNQATASPFSSQIMQVVLKRTHGGLGSPHRCKIRVTTNRPIMWRLWRFEPGWDGTSWRGPESQGF